tara:strand:+ start:3722 stop:4000 length:279 start_codon:yes stop_codon:yes gene_type:complete
MGNLKVFNSAGENDPGETMTSSGPTTGRAIDLFATKVSISGIALNSSQISINAAALQNVIAGAPEEMDSFKEVHDELGPDAFQDFLDALDGT